MITKSIRKMRRHRLSTTPATLKLDFGCGPNPREGFEGVDQYAFGGKVKHVMDIRDPWPFYSDSVAEAHSSHFVEHLDAAERVHFWNELYRVLVKDGKASIIVPHWASCRAYGDPTHKWPPVSEFAMYYLKREWRMGNAPHSDASNWKDGLSCDFDAVWGYGMHPEIQVKSQDAQQFSFQWYKEAIQDLHITVTAKK